METKILLRLLLIGCVISANAGIYAAAADDAPRAQEMTYAQERKTPSLQALARAAICREIKKIKKDVGNTNFKAAMQHYLADIPDTLREEITKELQEVETLINACQGNVTAALLTYLQKLKQNTEQKESDKAFALRYTTNIEAFIARGADVNSFDYSLHSPDMGGATPLHFAAKKGYAQMTKELLLYGANEESLDAPNIYLYTTPLMEAARPGHINVINLLLQAGADINATVRRGPNTGMTALAFAASTGQAETVSKLLDAGAYAETDHPSSATLAHAFDFKNNLDAIRMLIDKKANVNAQDIKDNTALMKAVNHDYSQEAVKLLLQAGADQTITNCMGQTAADIAGQARNQAVLDLLRR